MDINEIINGLSNAERRDGNCNNNGFFGGSWIWIIILFALCGCGGFGGNGGFGGGMGGYPGFGYDPGLYNCTVKCKKNKCGNIGGYGMLPYGQPGGYGCGGFNSWWWIILLIFVVCGCGRNNNGCCDDRRVDDDVC
ncbi:hypothetical protein [Clostridium sp. YIM B02551]|uniref:hypothetical protein n=1 Tax=Clostridium sp. YIM B02551 TaxID=2910679 RepID=UPI001EE9BC51|nr:hypothetical protein [Clostridium sp. YIM B02551]